MARDWERFYAEHAEMEVSAAPLLIEVAELLPPGRALDVACGAGGNAIYLAQLGWRVTAVDGAQSAIALLRRRAGGLAIDARVADLERHEFAIEPQGYDLICDFHYLQRDLFAEMREGVRPGGTFVGSIHLEGSFAMAPGELREEFAGWKVLFYSEGPEEDVGRRSARIVARRA